LNVPQDRFRSRPVRAAVILIALLPAACRIQEIPRPERVDIAQLAREEIRVTLEGWREAMLRGDADAVGAYFTTDGRLAAPDQPDIVGARAIADAMREQLRSFQVDDVVLHREDIHVAEGGVAYEMGSFIESVVLDGVPADYAGRYAIRWRRLPEAEWRIERFLFNYADQPADTTAAH
jgi:ketosteroid isomerase-like protein